MVSTSFRNVRVKTSSSANSKQYFDRSKWGETPYNSKQKLATRGMNQFREILFTERISEKASLLRTDARRSGANSHYEKSWRKWGNYSAGR